MRRVIGGFNPYQIEEISSILSNRWYDDISAQPVTGLLDVTLSEPTIMKVYDDKILLDLGSRKCEIESNSFCFILIE